MIDTSSFAQNLPALFDINLKITSVLFCKCRLYFVYFTLLNNIYAVFFGIYNVLSATIPILLMIIRSIFIIRNFRQSQHRRFDQDQQYQMFLKRGTEELIQ
ncbi:hypothetical protein I4U23_021668 [Adineta vaga]|nr:hypothetical protein I4U23_021668 [Adineta vaga]